MLRRVVVVSCSLAAVATMLAVAACRGPETNDKPATSSAPVSTVAPLEAAENRSSQRGRWVSAELREKGRVEILAADERVLTLCVRRDDDESTGKCHEVDLETGERRPS